jgi:hypothetical protein
MLAIGKYYKKRDGQLSFNILISAEAKMVEFRDIEKDADSLCDIVFWVVVWLTLIAGCALLWMQVFKWI